MTVPQAEEIVETRVASTPIRHCWRKTREWVRQSPIREPARMPLRWLRQMREWLALK